MLRGIGTLLKILKDLSQAGEDPFARGIPIKNKLGNVFIHTRILFFILCLYYTTEQNKSQESNGKKQETVSDAVAHRKGILGSADQMVPVITYSTMPGVTTKAPLSSLV